MDRLTEKLAVVGVVDPSADAHVAVTGDAVDMSKFKEVLFVLMAGAIAATGTVAWEIEESETSAFSSSQTLKDGTSLDASDDNTQSVIGVKAEDLSAGYRYVRAKITPATADANVAAVAVGVSAHYEPASDNDVASVAEILTV